MKKIYIDEKTGLVKKVVTINDQPTKTDQTQKEQCDVKNIMKKYGNKLSNVIPPSKGIYADISELPTYQQSLHIIRDAQNSFMSLPSHVRKKFDNDPGQMMSFLADSKNDEEARKLGLKNPLQPAPEKSEAEKYYANQNAKQKKASQKSLEQDQE